MLFFFRYVQNFEEKRERKFEILNRSIQTLKALTNFIQIAVLCLTMIKRTVEEAYFITNKAIYNQKVFSKTRGL